MMLAVAALIASVIVPARIDAIEKITAEVDALNARLKLSGPESRKRSNSIEEKLATFYGFFPAAETLPDWLDVVYAAAEKNAVRLDAGEYKLMQERGWKLQRYQITFPLKGSYSQVRGFVSQILAEIPALSLDEIDFRRDGIGSTVLDVRVRMTLFLGQPR